MGVLCQEIANLYWITLLHQTQYPGSFPINQDLKTKLMLCPSIQTLKSGYTLTKMKTMCFWILNSPSTYGINQKLDPIVYFDITK